jgi:hypothetical protein
MPPAVWRVPIYVAGWLVPARERAPWRRRWASSLDAWHTLAERGEVSAGGGAAMVKHAWSEACEERFGALCLHRLLRGPVFLVAACVAVLLLIALCSHGFAASRSLVALAQDMRLHPDLGVRYDLRGDRLFEYLAPVVISASIGAALLLLKHRSLRSLGWRSWSLLVIKVVSIHLDASLVWVEGGHALRAQLAREGFRFGIAGLALAVAFVLGFGLAIIWCVADQRRRCPVCLHRLVLPVTMGSWASICFDPASTELVCEEGHGSLALMEAEADASAPDRWIELDASWQYLFHENPAGTNPQSGKSR